MTYFLRSVDKIREDAQNHAEKMEQDETLNMLPDFYLSSTLQIQSIFAHFLAEELERMVKEEEERDAALPNES